MKKRIAGIILVCCFLFCGVAYGAEPVNAHGSKTTMYVDEVQHNIYPYNIEGCNYFKLRDIGTVLAETDKAFSLEWDNVNNAIRMNTEEDYNGPQNIHVWDDEKHVVAQKVPVTIYCDDNAFRMDAYNIDGFNYFKLRDISKVLGCITHWDPAIQSIKVFTDELKAEEAIKPAAPPVITTNNVSPTANLKTLINNAPLNPKKTQYGCLNNLVDQFMVQNFKPGMDTYTKVKVTYDYFIKNMRYTTGSQLQRNMFTAQEWSKIYQHYPERYAIPILIDHKGVCNHYASAYAAILRGIGLDATVVNGQTKSSKGGRSNHVWLNVRLNGTNYLFDPQVDQRISQRRGHNSYDRFGIIGSRVSNNYWPAKAHPFATSL